MQSINTIRGESLGSANRGDPMCAELDDSDFRKVEERLAG